MRIIVGVALHQLLSLVATAFSVVALLVCAVVLGLTWTGGERALTGPGSDLGFVSIVAGAFGWFAEKATISRRMGFGVITFVIPGLRFAKRLADSITYSSWEATMNTYFGLSRGSPDEGVAFLLYTTPFVGSLGYAAGAFIYRGWQTVKHSGVFARG